MPSGEGLRPVRCLVWVEPPDASAAGELVEGERARWLAFHEQQDRDRFATGAALVRRALRAATGDASAVPLRWCEDCGRRDHGPVTAGGRHAGTVGISLSHSADRVVVAVSLGATHVGVDVEVVRTRPPGLARMLCTAHEAAADLGADRTDLALTTRWVRKEAVLKAARIGLRVPLQDLEVTDHRQPAGLRSWHPRTRPPATDSGVGCVDLGASELGEGYVGALAVLTSRPVECRLASGPAFSPRPA